MAGKKRDSSDISSPSDTSPTTPSKKAKGKAATSSPAKVKSESSSSGDSGEVQGKKTGPWFGEELRMLYSIMCPKRTGVKWDEVAAQIPGRDVKSCTNKWARVQGKIMEAIEALGE
ncbi:hypothetical protein BD324DRAFT_652950 [Kockovaella imperatae]|uniref:Myb-like domain-containing protein n=1 Tax=Kockovaella imperatae TaxID=4999 RepID=A0A1Y1UB07_9TREE|nr:hypothetical protein BD324DRAFT_652950 [Kockovaella imperatae]ORX34686.1 hypothetical protein BD324DRAFT_652950 [Kockovaella imperatae]